MSLVLNEEQMSWACEKAENPLKRLLRIYFVQFDKDTIHDWLRNNKVTLDQIPQTYQDQATHIRATKKPSDTDDLLFYPAKPGHIKYKHRAAGWLIYLDLVASTIEWDDEMVANHIKRTMSQMLESVKILLGIYKQRFPDLLGTLSITMDDKNLTLVLKDSRFPEANFPSRIGFVIEKIYM
jgi:hypothetical protein